MKSSLSILEGASYSIQVFEPSAQNSKNVSL